MTSLAIIIVSWNVRDLLRRCLQSLDISLNESGLSTTTLVVDNASSDGTPAMLRTEFPAVRLIEAGGNVGFAAGNNLAFAALGLGGAVPTPDYVLLLNPDTEVVGTAIARLVSELAAHPTWVGVGPRLRYADGSVQSSRRRFPTRMTFFWESTPLARLWPENPWARHYHCADVPDEHMQAVDWLVGAALLLRADAIVQAGWLDARFFMYSEELEWQYRLQQVRGFSGIMYVPEAEVMHYEGKSSEQAVARRHIRFEQSKLLLARMWFGWRFAGIVRGALRLGYGYELAIETIKLLLRHRPDVRRQRIKVYREIMSAL